MLNMFAAKIEWVMLARDVCFSIVTLRAVPRPGRSSFNFQNHLSLYVI